MNFGFDTIRFSRATVKQPVLVLPSLNLESVAEVSDAALQVILDESDGHLVLDRKTPVDGLVVYDAPQGGKAARVTFHSGHTQTFSVGRMVTERVAAGSAANIANALREMGRTAVGILGAVGSGGDGEVLMSSLSARGLNEVILLPRRDQHGTGGTGESLFLRSPTGRMVILSRKPAYEIDTRVPDFIHETTTARLVVCTGFLPYEFPLVEAALSTRHQPEARILAPHRGCFDTGPNRARCLEFAARASLFQVNLPELEELLELQGEWAKTGETERGEILRRIPAEIVCVTCNGQGSFTYLRSENRLICQPAAEVQTIRNQIGAGDVHLATLLWYLWLRERRIELAAALEAASWIAARKIEFVGGGRPWEGIPSSRERKSIVHAAEQRARARRTP